jgi:hypothetical protein
MANVPSLNAISSGTPAVASAVSDNFDKISQAINSGALNSENYGADSILSQHIANDAVVAAKVRASQMRHNHLDFVISNGGVRVPQIGNSDNNLPANGVVIGRYTATLFVGSGAVSASRYVSWGNAIDGDPGFTETPVMCGAPVIYATHASAQVPTGVMINTIDSEVVGFKFVWSASQGADYTATVHFEAKGGK